MLSFNLTKLSFPIVDRHLGDVPTGNGSVTADPVEEAEEEALAFMAAFIGLIVLAVGFLVVHLLRQRKISSFPEAWVFFLIGLILAGIINAGISHNLVRIYEYLRRSFNQLFFIVLLPPVIFESGYSMNKRQFFSNFGGICTFAVLGTLIATVATGVVLWILGMMNVCFSFSMLDSLTFGAIISAVDPITVLAVFQALGVDQDLYALVFGESVLNDAVSIVLYHTMLNFHAAESVTLGAILMGALYFTVIFFGSVVIGFGMGVGAAILFKVTSLGRRNANLERALLTLWPFLSYMLAEGMQLSGVVSILFSGITMAHYTVRNLTPPTRKFSLHLFEILATIAEALVFIYIGLACPSVFGNTIVGREWTLLIAAVIACLVGRYVNVASCSYIVNACSRRNGQGTKITKVYQFVLWFAGLRGGVSFALSSSARNMLGETEQGILMESTTLFIVVMTMVLIGGTIGPLVRSCDLIPHVRRLREQTEAQCSAQTSITTCYFSTNENALLQKNNNDAIVTVVPSQSWKGPASSYGLSEDGWLPPEWDKDSDRAQYAWPPHISTTEHILDPEKRLKRSLYVRQQHLRNLHKQRHVEWRWPSRYRESVSRKLSSFIPFHLRQWFKYYIHHVKVWFKSGIDSVRRRRFHSRQYESLSPHDDSPANFDRTYNRSSALYTMGDHHHIKQSTQEYDHLTLPTTKELHVQEEIDPEYDIEAIGSSASFDVVAVASSSPSSNTTMDHSSVNQNQYRVSMTHELETKQWNANSQIISPIPNGSVETTEYSDKNTMSNVDNYENISRSFTESSRQDEMFKKANSTSFHAFNSDHNQGVFESFSTPKDSSEATNTMIMQQYTTTTTSMEGYDTQADHDMGPMQTNVYDNTTFRSRPSNTQSPQATISYHTGDQISNGLQSHLHVQTQLSDDTYRVAKSSLSDDANNSYSYGDVSGMVGPDTVSSVGPSVSNNSSTVSAALTDVFASAVSAASMDGSVSNGIVITTDSFALNRPSISTDSFMSAKSTLSTAASVCTASSTISPSTKISSMSMVAPVSSSRSLLHPSSVESAPAEITPHSEEAMNVEHMRRAITSRHSKLQTAAALVHRPSIQTWRAFDSRVLEPLFVSSSSPEMDTKQALDTLTDTCNGDTDSDEVETQQNQSVMQQALRRTMGMALDTNNNAPSNTGHDNGVGSTGQSSSHATIASGSPMNHTPGSLAIPFVGRGLPHTAILSPEAIDRLQGSNGMISTNSHEHDESSSEE